MVGGARAGGGPEPIHTVVEPPDAAPRRSTRPHRGSSAGADSEQDVAGRRTSARSDADRVGVDDGDRRQRALADDHRVHELDRHVVALLRASGGQHHIVAPAENRRANVTRDRGQVTGMVVGRAVIA